MKISIPKSEILKFLELSTYTDITPDSIKYVPITEFILVRINKGFCKMTLTSTNSFVSYTFSISDQSNETFLLSYLELKSFYSGTNRKEVLIVTEKKISDGSFSKNLKVSEDLSVEKFPTQPSLIGLEYKRFSPEIIRKLSISKKYILDEKKDKLRPILNVSSIKGNLLMASTGQISCLFDVSEDISFSTFSLKEIGLISNFDYFDYLRLDNWNIIKYKTIIYGNRFPDIEHGTLHEIILDYVEKLDKTKTIKLNVEQFYNFCKSVKSYAIDETVPFSISVSSNQTILSYLDKQNDISFSENVDSVIVGYSELKINLIQTNILKVLESLPNKQINISKCDGGNFIGFWLDDDSSFHSICSKAIDI